MISIFNKEFGKRVSLFREQREMAIEELATLARIPWTVLAVIESGQHFPTLGQLERLLTALETTWPELTAELLE